MVLLRLVWRIVHKLGTGSLLFTMICSRERTGPVGSLSAGGVASASKSWHSWWVVR